MEPRQTTFVSPASVKPQHTRSVSTTSASNISRLRRAATRPSYPTYTILFVTGVGRRIDARAPFSADMLSPRQILNRCLVAPSTVIASVSDASEFEDLCARTNLHPRASFVGAIVTHRRARFRPTEVDIRSARQAQSRLRLGQRRTQHGASHLWQIVVSGGPAVKRTQLPSTRKTAGRNLVDRMSDLTKGLFILEACWK